MLTNSRPRRAADAPTCAVKKLSHSDTDRPPPGNAPYLSAPDVGAKRALNDLDRIGGGRRERRVRRRLLVGGRRAPLERRHARGLMRSFARLRRGLDGVPPALRRLDLVGGRLWLKRVEGGKG